LIKTFPNTKVVLVTTIPARMPNPSDWLHIFDPWQKWSL